MQLTDLVHSSRLRETPTGCVEWAGHVGSRDGYGRLTIGGKNWLAHRLAYVLAHGDPGPSAEVDHRCHNRACVNLSHLRAATRQQNARNMPGPRCDSASAARGVRELPSGRWQAYIVVGGSFRSLGTYDTKASAAMAASEGRRSTFGEYAGALA